MKRSVLTGLTVLALTAFLLTGCKKTESETPDETPTTETPATAPAGAGADAGAEAGASMTEDLQDAVVLNFSVKKMTCGNCVEKVTTTVAQIDGVKSCNVSLADESAVVKVDDASRADAIIAAITKAGFEAQQTEG